jgi:hypothetical protein
VSFGADGDKRICVVDGAEPGKVIAALGPYVDASKLVAGKQPDVIRVSDMYLRPGDFFTCEVVRSWKAATSEVMHDGRHDVVRALMSPSATGEEAATTLTRPPV